MVKNPTSHTYTVKPKREKFSYDVEGIIMFFGGFPTYQRLLTEHGMDAPTYNNFRSWRTRNTISSDLIARTLRLAHILGLDFNLHDYVLDPLSWRKPLPAPAVQPDPPPDPNVDPEIEERLERLAEETASAPEQQMQEQASAAPMGARQMRRKVPQ